MMQILRALALGAALTAAPAGAGDIDPPGAPGSSFPTLGEIHSAALAASGGRTPLPPAGFNPAADFPITITQPGSYVLTGNLTAGENANGIVIQASNVTIDLNGFTLSGASGVGSGDGILVSDTADFVNIVVTNGTVRSWGADGVDLTDGDLCEVSRVRAINNGDDGIVTGRGCAVRDCHAALNGGRGIAVGRDSLVLDCVVLDQGSSGITANAGSTIRGNVTASNFHGIELLEGDSLVVGNASRINERDGIHFHGTRSRIEANHLINNGDDGIDRSGTADVDNLVVRNSARGNIDADFTGNTDNDFGSITTSVLSANPWANLDF